MKMLPSPIRVAVILLGVRLIWIYAVPAWNEISTDFPNYYTAAWAVRHEASLPSLYDPVWFQEETLRAGIAGQAALFDSFPPFSAMVMWPIAGFSPLTAKRIWIVVNLMALAIAVLIVAKRLKTPVAPVLLIALLGGDALGNNFAFGQFYLVLTLLIVVAMVYVNRLPVVAGWCLALAVVVKLFPLFLLGYFAMLRAWKAVAWTLIGIAALSLTGIAVMGWAPHRVYVEEVFSRSVRGEVQDPYNVRSNSLQALLRRALVAESGLNPRPIVDVPALYFFLRPFLIVVILFTTLLTVGAVHDRPQSGGPRSASATARSLKERTQLQFGMLLSALLLTIPAQASYQQILLFPGIAGVMHIDLDKRVRIVCVIAFALMCSNYMGAASHLDAGIVMLAAFPRVYLVLALWIGFVYLTGSRPRLAPIVAAATLIATISAFVEHRRWNSDGLDRAVMAQPQAAGFVEAYPESISGGLTYLTMRSSGFFRRFPDGSELQIDDVPMRGMTSTVDGNFVAFSEWINGRYRIAEWSRATGQTRTLLEGPADYRYPAYDPSGQWLAFATNETGNWDIGRWSRADGRQSILTGSKANDLMPWYSSDGRTIYFASDRRRGYRFTAIYAIALSGERL